jgi:predicted metal-dependent hydrolase
MSFVNKISKPTLPSNESGKLDTQNIAPRRFRISYDHPEKIDKHWVGNNGFLSNWMNAYTLTIPGGEDFNVRTIRSYIDDISEDELKNTAQGFIAQELSHGKAHEKFFHVLESQGYNIKIFLSVYKFLSFKVLEPLSTKLSKLAFVVAVERINELIAEVNLDHKLLDDSPAEAANLYKWHFAEEIEHKSVAYDIYQDVSGNRFMLAYSTLLCYIINLMFLILGTTACMVQDGSILNPKNWLRGFRYFFTKEKFFWKVSWGCIELQKKSFHPSQSKNLHLADEILNSRDVTA